MSDPTLTVKKTGKKFVLREGVLRVGRSESNNLLLRSQSASRLHAVFERSGKIVWITDLKSRNGTYINGLRLAPEAKTILTSGDEIRFGRSIVLVIDGCADPVQVRGSVPEPNPAQVREPVPASPSQKEAFGFAPNRIEFEVEGVATDAAAELSKRFRPIQVVSSGGMGKILLVQEILSGRFVAMKVMLERATRTKSLVQQFIREAIITARLQHPHIIPVHDLGFLGGNQLYYTMSYIESTPLRALLAKLDLLESLRILRCAALAVDFAHSKGLWHRDLKPGNILVGPLGDTYVIDWGLVSVQHGREYKLNIPKIVLGNLDMVIPDNLIRETADAITHATGAGNRLGTPLYMAPEQWREHEPDVMGPGCDVWAFGVMLFESLTGRHPLHVGGGACQSPLEIMMRVMDEPLPNPCAVRPDVPDELGQLCVRLLQRDIRHRPLDLKDFLDTTTHFLRTQGHGLTSFGNSGANGALAAALADNARLRAELDHLRRPQTP